MGLDNPLHIAFLLILLLLVFGAKRLPEMGRSLGSGMRGFRESLSGESPQAPAQAPVAHVQAAPLVTPTVPPASPAAVAVPATAIGDPQTPAAA